MARVRIPTLSSYRPDYRWRYTTHYFVVNRRDEMVSPIGKSKRDAILNATINAECAPASGPYTVVRCTGHTGAIKRLDTI